MNEKLECLKLASELVSPSVNDRVGEVKRIASLLYTFITESDSLAHVSTDTPKRGRPKTAPN